MQPHLLLLLLPLLESLLFVSSLTSSSCQSAKPWSEWSVWTQECTGRLAEQFPEEAADLASKASAISQFSTRQRDCQCGSAGNCPTDREAQLRWRHPPPAQQHYLAVSCAWCNWESWSLCSDCTQIRRRDCLCRKDNRSLYGSADARRCSLGWAIEATMERREVGNSSDGYRRRYPPPLSPNSNGRGGGWIFGDLTSAFPDVFKAVFVLVALVIALISCRGLCILVQSRFGDSGSLDSIYRPGPGDAEPQDDLESSRPLAVDESSVGVGDSFDDVVEIRSSADGKRSSRASYPDPFTPSHPLSVVHEPLEEVDDDEDDDEVAEASAAAAEQSTVPKQRPQPPPPGASFIVEAALVSEPGPAFAAALTGDSKMS